MPKHVIRYSGDIDCDHFLAATTFAGNRNFEGERKRGQHQKILTKN